MISWQDFPYINDFMRPGLTPSKDENSNWAHWANSSIWTCWQANFVWNTFSKLNKRNEGLCTKPNVTSHLVIEFGQGNVKQKQK